MRRTSHASAFRPWIESLKKAIPAAALLGLAACGGGGSGGEDPAALPGDGVGNPPFGGSAEAAAFVDNHDGTVMHSATGLVWLQDANCLVSRAAAWYEQTGQMPWRDAMDSVRLLAAGKCRLSDYSKPGDWRLATRDELLAFANAEPKGSPLFRNIQNNWYWTSESYGGDDSIHAYEVTFAWRNSWAVGDKRDSRFVWPVRQWRPRYDVAAGH